MATCAMGIAWHIFGKRKLMGTIGLAIVGAVFHNMGQLLTVFVLLTYNVYLFYQIPFMIVASIVFGILVGLLAPMLAQLANGASDKMGGGAIRMPLEQAVFPLGPPARQR